MNVVPFTRKLAAAVAALLFLPSAAHAQSSPSAYTTGTRYDAMGRITGTIAPDPDGTGPLKHAALRNSYDSAGRLTRVESGELSAWQSEAIAPASWTGFTVTRSVDTLYDVRNRKIRESVTGSDGVVKSVTQYSYDSSSRLECAAVRMNPATFGSLPASACTLGTQGTQGPDRITRNVYDAAGQLLQVREGVGTGIEASEATYSYTINGKRQYVIDANGNRAEQIYDGFDRQAKWIFPSTVRPAGFNDSSHNQYTSAGPASFTYDANGNLTSDGSTSFVYDIENRLVSASGARTANLVYDPLGRLFETSGGTSGVTRFLYDGDRLAIEYDELGAIKWRYFFGPNVDEPLLADPGGQLNCDLGTRFLHSDHQGSIVAQADCWGNRQAINSYDEYGIPAATNQGRFQYTGQAWIPELGMYHYKNRIYSPTLGRFLQTDPIGYDDQINLYAYVGNDPMNFADPNGTDRWGIEFEIKIAVGQYGFRATIEANYDTESKEVGASVTGGYRAGAALGAKVEGYREPSSEKGNEGSIEAKAVAEAAIEAKSPVGKLGVAGEATAGAKLSSKDGLTGQKPAISGGVSRGALAQDSVGRTTVSVGGNVGAAVGGDVKASVNIKVPEMTPVAPKCTDQYC